MGIPPEDPLATRAAPPQALAIALSSAAFVIIIALALYCAYSAMHDCHDDAPPESSSADEEIGDIQEVTACLVKHPDGKYVLGIEGASSSFRTPISVVCRR